MNRREAVSLANKHYKARTILVNTLEDRVLVLEERLQMITRAFYEARSILTGNKHQNLLNKDGIPYNVCLIGEKDGKIYTLVAFEDDTYHMGDQIFTSLTTPATDICGYKRNGWEFWRLLDGRYIRDVYGEKQEEEAAAIGGII